MFRSTITSLRAVVTSRDSPPPLIMISPILILPKPATAEDEITGVGPTTVVGIPFSRVSATTHGTRSLTPLPVAEPVDVPQLANTLLRLENVPAAFSSSILLATGDPAIGGPLY